MTKPLLAIACRANELEQKLAESIELYKQGARFVDPATLPTERDLVAVHAQLARVCREPLRRR